MISEGVDIRRLRAVVYATNRLTELAFRQIIGRVVRTDPTNHADDHGLVVIPADPTLVRHANRICRESGTRIAAPVVINEPPVQRTVNIYQGAPAGQFVPLDSTGDLDLVVDPATGRSAPADLVRLAKEYVERSGSPVPAFELALAAANDPAVAAALRGDD